MKIINIVKYLAEKGYITNILDGKNLKLVVARKSASDPLYASFEIYIADNVEIANDIFQKNLRYYSDWMCIEDDCDFKIKYEKDSFIIPVGAEQIIVNQSTNYVLIYRGFHEEYSNVMTNIPL